MAAQPPQPASQLSQLLQDIAHKLRIHSIEATEAAKSGHPTSCSSIAEIMCVLFFHVMRYDLKNPKHPSHDRFILSKGHAAPIFYATLAEAGLFPVATLKNLRKVDSNLEGHPTPRLSFVDVATGSLGQGLSAACGMAYVGKYVEKASYRTYCLLGDGESAEGSVWEALDFAAHYKLDNLCAIFDVNGQGQTGPAPVAQHLRERVAAFGFHVIVVDGHNVDELCAAFGEAGRTQGKPTAILANTRKGKYFPGIEGENGWHGKPLVGDRAQTVIQAIKSLIRNPQASSSSVQRPSPVAPFPSDVPSTAITLNSPPAYRQGDQVATRLAYGTALAKIAATNSRVLALDGDVSNSTYADKVKETLPDQFVECYIAEQNMVGVAIGAGCRGRTVPFASTFAAFFSRAFDQIRMAAVSMANVKFAGSHCGLSVGHDGPSQMALEDLALFRSIPGCTIFYPSDAVSTERAVELAANTKGICFIRTTRPDTEVFYANEEHFAVGKAKVLAQSADDQLLIIAAGFTLSQALQAAKELKKCNINVRVLDPFTVKPLDADAVICHAERCVNRILTVEDHYQEGGLGEAVMSAVAECPHIAVRKMAVRQVPRSGTTAELADLYGISAKCIVRCARNFVLSDG